MLSPESLNLLLTSTVIAGILSAIVSAIVSIKLKDQDYRHEYFKKILDKRLEAYHFIETQIAGMKSSVLDENARAYHLIFAYGKDKFYEYQHNLFVALSYSMWINDRTVVHMEKLDELFFNISRRIDETDDNTLIILGKDYYREISDLRQTLEGAVRNDLLNLHDLNKFRKSVGQRRRERVIQMERRR
ncbi:hypothetical protein [Catalinimonas niigatensis]|uniref:hypothetical protein n=1 Tax=Catalinimonas niigatensis TaxID=1397264 RepID=UPI00266516F9|nr:hypothetical protein [Catalinimonas niigatensis]WPP52165.1 hypothetical protein PZB72_07205 [Catalinimonas niigatensis]